eukprot:Skav230686  [mRNA]  locus=scaffold2202:126441:130379:+ [translate_table: standard]
MTHFGKETVVHAGVTNVMAQRCYEKRKLLQFRQESARAGASKHTGHTMEHIHCMSEAVKGHRQVLLLHCRGEALEHRHLISRVDKAFTIFVELADGVDRQIDALVLGEVQRIERPGIKNLLGHSEIFQAH